MSFRISKADALGRLIARLSGKDAIHFNPAISNLPPGNVERLNEAKRSHPFHGGYRLPLPD